LPGIFILPVLEGLAFCGSARAAPSRVIEEAKKAA